MVRKALVATLLGCLMGAGLVSVSTVTASAEYKPWGTTKSKNHVLRSGCHNYAYRYRINPPNGDWAAEIFLSGPTKVKIASAALISESDPAKGVLQWRMCRPSVTYGRYKMRMKITYRTGPSGFGLVTGWVKPSFFKLTRPRR